MCKFCLRPTTNETAQNTRAARRLTKVFLADLIRCAKQKWRPRWGKGSIPLPTNEGVTGELIGKMPPGKPGRFPRNNAFTCPLIPPTRVENHESGRQETHLQDGYAARMRINRIGACCIRPFVQPSSTPAICKWRRRRSRCSRRTGAETKPSAPPSQRRPVRGQARFHRNLHGPMPRRRRPVPRRRCRRLRPKRPRPRSRKDSRRIAQSSS